MEERNEVTSFAEGKERSEATPFTEGKDKRRQIIYDGREGTVRSFCVEYGIDYSAVMHRIERLKETPEQAINHFVHGSVFYVYKGRKFSTLKALCDEFDISPAAVSYRKKKYPDKPLSEILDDIKDKTFMYNGIRYKNLANCCRALNIRYDSVLQARRLYGLTNKEAVERVSGKRRK